MMITTSTQTILEEPFDQRKRLERRWFWIALLPLVNLYYTISSTQGYFMAVLGLDDPLLSCIVISVMAAALFLIPLLLKRQGILDNPIKLRIVFIIVSAIGIAAFAIYGVMYRLARPDAIWPAIILQGMIGVSCAVIAGCALQLAIKVISVKSAALLCGLTMIIVSVLTVIHLLFLGQIQNSSYPIEYMATSYFLIYTIMLIIPIIRLPVDKDDFAFTAPRITVYFNGDLFYKFIVLAALIMLTGILSDSTYYADGDFENYFNEWFTFATMLLPIVGAGIYTLLLRKNKWLPAIASMLLLACFGQGLILFFDDRVQLAAAYGLTDALTGFGGVIFRLFIPMVFCLQKRENAHAAIGLTSAWMILNSIIIASKGSVSSVSPFVTPAITFVLIIVTIAYLFYLYSENNRVYIAGLIAEFKARDMSQVNDAVSKADRFEGLGLAPREREVCALLLKSFTVRQIAGELGLAFATVNGYYRSLYRKLNINSKAELFMRFAPDTQSDQ